MAFDQYVLSRASKNKWLAKHVTGPVLDEAWSRHNSQRPFDFGANLIEEILACHSKVKRLNKSSDDDYQPVTIAVCGEPNERGVLTTKVCRGNFEDYAPSQGGQDLGCGFVFGSTENKETKATPQITYVSPMSSGKITRDGHAKLIESSNKDLDQLKRGKECVIANIAEVYYFTAGKKFVTFTSIAKELSRPKISFYLRQGGEADC